MLQIYFSSDTATFSFLECHDEAKIVNCNASSGVFGSNWGCDKVYSDTAERDWEIAPNDQTSPWIQIDLEHEYEIRQLRIKQRGREEDRFMQVDIKFSDGASKDQCNLPNHADWIEIPLEKRPISKFVKIIRKKSMRSTDKGGLDKIKVFGCQRGNFDFKTPI